MRHVIASLAALLLVLAGAAKAAEIPVSPATFAAAFTATAATKGGDVIIPAPGGYKPYVKGGGRVFDPPVTVQCGPGVLFSGYTPWTDIGGVTLKDCTFEDPAGTSVLIFTRARTIKVLGGSFTGVDAGLGKGSGLQFNASTGFVVDGVAFKDLRGGISINGSPDVTITRSTFEGITSDGIIIVNPVNVRVTDNRMTNFSPLPLVHPDAIQFWTTTDFTGRDIWVTGNEITRGAGQPVQQLFFQRGGGLGYENFNAEDNLGLGGTGHGLSLYSVASGRAANNVMLGYEGSYASRVLCTGCGPALVIAGNTSQDIVFAGATDGGGNVERAGIKEADAEAYVAAWRKRHDPPADPKDAEIARLTAQLAAANNNIAGLQVALDMAAAAAKAREDVLRAERDALAEKVRKALVDLAA